MAKDINQARKELIRWMIMTALNAGRPIGCNEGLLLRAVFASDNPVTPDEIRRELDYLKGHDIVHITKPEGEPWSAILTSKGVDIFEYNADCPEGIARPFKYW